jgi:PPP family 3-phenylpropionic acid transporter
LTDPGARQGPARRDGLTALAFAAFFTATGAEFPYLPVYLGSLGLDLPTIGVLFGAVAGTQFIAAPLWGAMTDRLGSYRPTMLAAVALAIGAALVLASGRTLPVIVPAALCLGAGLIGLESLLNGRTIQGLGTDRTRFGRSRLWGSIAFMVASLGVGVLIDRGGPGALFTVLVLALLVVAAVAAALPRVHRERQPDIFRGAALLLRDPVMTTFLLGTLIQWAAVVAVNTYLSLYLVSLGAPGWAVGLAWALSAAAQVPIMWFYERLVERFGMTRLIAVGAIAYACRPLLYAGLGTAGIVVVLTTLEGIGYAFFICGGVAFVSTRAPHSLSATAQGMFSGASQGLAAVIGASIGGLVAGSFSIETMFVAAGLVGLAAAVFITRVAAAGERLPPPWSVPRVRSERDARLAAGDDQQR